MTSWQEDEKFADDLFNDMLPKVIDWIKENMAPEDVFREADLKEWAEEKGYELEDE